jgi:hypothetical protein
MTGPGNLKDFVHHVLRLTLAQPLMRDKSVVKLSVTPSTK